MLGGSHRRSGKCSALLGPHCAGGSCVEGGLSVGVIERLDWYFRDCCGAVRELSQKVRNSISEWLGVAPCGDGVVVG